MTLNNEPDPAACCTQVSVSVVGVQGMDEDKRDQKGRFKLTYSVVGCGKEPVWSVTVNYSLDGGTAKPGGEDFNEAATGTVVLYAIDTEGYAGEGEVLLTVVQEDLDESTEQARLDMTFINPSNPNAVLFVSTMSAGIDVLSEDVTIIVENNGTQMTGNSFGLDVDGAGRGIPNPRTLQLKVTRGGAPVGGAMVRLKFYDNQWEPGTMAGLIDPATNLPTNAIAVTTGSDGRANFSTKALTSPGNPAGSGKFSAAVVDITQQPEKVYPNITDFTVIVWP